MTFDARQFRDALGCFATGVSVVTSFNQQNEPLGVTVNSFSSVSLEPPLILFSLGHAGNHCQEYQQSGKFAVNILSDKQMHLCERFASPIEDRFSGVDHQIGENGAPVFEDSLSILECETFALQEAGDHLVFICRVTNVIAHTDEEPLLFYKGAFPRFPKA
ncbi:flavin reductase family protein [Sneathiella glossodoripedis]|uniref:flavin reductase family protein n=1 Tax=Sneathiella glossodoripedis TaxID=418853 RepID=UPI00046FB9BA|nr:flavin reductase family protein [Sneathiella glossodoripedis]